ncbi:MAG: DEAD/DEAH box helicase [Chloroflexi bacterium]|nr:DEAD/DEAH box helicase [Chloroflexota bacterium]
MAPPVDVKASRRFLADAGRLPDAQGANLETTVRLIAEHGITYGSLKTRPIERNPDRRFRLMNVDDGYRIVAAVEGRHVFLLKVGNHDETERWGERATLRELEQRLAFDPVILARAKRIKAASNLMFEIPPTLAEIAASDEVADLLTNCVDGVLEGWRDGTIEEWMIFLSPVQRRAVDRAVGGPARVTGGPGTGKSVVGLHRAVALARESPDGQKVLMTSFVNTVPGVLEGLFERLAPDLKSKMQFASVHSLAMKALAGRQPKVDADAARRRFLRRLQAQSDRYRQLSAGARLSDEYLWEEVTRVIEGRGLTRRVEYLGLQRHGRKRPLPAMIRGLIWDVYEEYRAACDTGNEPLVDWDRVLQLALDEVRANPPRERYSAVIVDEAQDISEVGIRFLLELLEGGASGRIMLIGDAGQRIYPGGYRLSELGLEIRGRSFPMSVCYRSTDEIMQVVGALGQYVSTDEFGEDGVRGLSTATVRSGNRPRLAGFDRVDDEVAWIMGQLDVDDPDLDATGILVFTNRKADSLRARLRDSGIGSVPLEEYRGRSVPGVKVGTYHRAKGLEFKRLYVPGLDDSFPRGDTRDPDELIEAGSLLYVALSRAKDELTLSYAGNPSMFIDAVRPHVEVVEEAARP